MAHENNTLYVQELFNTTGIAATAGEKQALVDGLGNGTETRASVLRDPFQAEMVKSFILSPEYRSRFGQP